MSTLAECIDRYEADLPNIRLPGHAIRVAMLTTKAWRQDVKHLDGKFASHGLDSRDAERCRALAETGELWGLERVGLVVR